MELVFALLIGVIAGSLITFFLMKSLAPKQIDLTPELTKANSELITEREAHNLLKGRFQVVSEAHDELEGKLTEANIEINKLSKDNTSLAEKLNNEKSNNKTTEEMREGFLKEFKSIANEVISDNTTKFNQASSEKLSSVLNPFNEKIKEFEHSIKTIRNAEIAESTELKTEIKSIRELNMVLSTEAKRLTDALKGDNKLQGNWGELVLENLLNASGLRCGEDYIIQGSGMDLRDSEDKVQRPDIMVRLPDQKHLILDSKVSLRSYEKYFSAQTDGEREVALKEFHKSIKEHIKGLSDKNYHMNEKLNSPEFVFMFIPIEGAFCLYLETCENAFEFAHDRNIYIVSPTTIMPTLKTAALIWRQQKQSRHTMDIMNLAGEIYDKFATMSEYLVKVENSLEKSKEAYLEYRNRLSTGRKPILRMLEEMKELGAKTSKEIAITYQHHSAPILAEAIITESLKNMDKSEA